MIKPSLEDLVRRQIVAEGPNYEPGYDWRRYANTELEAMSIAELLERISDAIEIQETLK